MKYLFAVFVASLVGLLGLYLGVLPATSRTPGGMSTVTAQDALPAGPQDKVVGADARVGASDGGATAPAGQAAEATEATEATEAQVGAARLALSVGLSAPEAAAAAGAAAPAATEPMPVPVLTAERSLPAKDLGAAASGAGGAAANAGSPTGSHMGDSAGSGAGSGASAPAAAPSAASAPAVAAVLTVTVTRPQASPMAKGILADGNVVAWQEAVVGAESQIGRLTQINAQVGDRVRKGQVLAVGSTELAQAELAQLEAAAEEARAALTEASANAQRARDVKDSGALSPQQVGQYLTAERTAQARWSAQSAAVEAQRVRIRNSTVRAPDDGIISSRSATVGAVVPPGAEMFRLIRQGRLEWRAEVNGTELSAIRTGQKARVQLPGGEALQGVVRVVSPVVDPTSRRGVVYVDLPNPGTARPGLFAKGGIELGSSEALTLPRAAVLLRDGFYWVFTVGADNRVTQAKVTVGRNVGDRIEVTSGLAADARVVAGGTGFLSDGDVVRVVQGAAAASGS